MRFYFQDQFNGFANKLDVHLRRSAPESGSSVARAFYSKLLNITSHTAFHEVGVSCIPCHASPPFAEYGSHWRALPTMASLVGSHRLKIITVTSSEAGEEKKGGILGIARVQISLAARRKKGGSIKYESALDASYPCQRSNRTSRAGGSDCE